MLYSGKGRDLDSFAFCFELPGEARVCSALETLGYMTGGTRIPNIRVASRSKLQPGGLKTDL